MVLPPFLVLFIKLDTRIVGRMVGEHRPSGSNAMSVLVKNDITFVFDELGVQLESSLLKEHQDRTLHALNTRYTSAQPPGLPMRSKPDCASFLRNASEASHLLQRVRTSFNAMCRNLSLRVVMRDLAADVVENVRLRNTVCGETTEPTHECTTIAQETAVESREGTTRERELWCTEMRQ